VSNWPATASLVGVAWLKAVLGLDAVATDLPRPDGGTLSWASTKTVDGGFITCRPLIAGGANIDVPQRRGSKFQVDTWASAGGSSNKPLWNRADDLGERIRIAHEDRGNVYGLHGIADQADIVVASPFTIALPNNHDTARVLAAYLISEPTRVENDPSGYARVTVDLAIDWVRP
jgi:hypothetical protein